MQFAAFSALAALAVLASFVHGRPVPVDGRTIEELNASVCPWLKLSLCDGGESN
ncbi:hypothetical protein FA95DRAFT_1610048 [Auriscalpium vulgare]|uniref:Uncharacterized protein n=1 Tax=Auriscalpium vulgare TaxID=40419 RepID=A0ACB8RFE0_9AGAM|nr:hypothetical protein FA95DRAFT_1610048 [Auriscalpium vulgare]